MCFLDITNETEAGFGEIAKKLFFNHAIKTHDSLFRFIEIEFYWNSSSHIDNSTYQRKYVDPKAGDWFFHYSGVDIALKNEETGGYGGILIRSVYDINQNKLYKGPMVCSMKLFSGTNAFTENIKTKIIEHNFESITIEKGERIGVTIEIEKSERIGLGDNAKKNGADKLNYRFFIDSKKIV